MENILLSRSFHDSKYGLISVFLKVRERLGVSYYYIDFDNARSHIKRTALAGYKLYRNRKLAENEFYRLNKIEITKMKNRGYYVLDI